MIDYLVISVIKGFASGLPMIIVIWFIVSVSFYFISDIGRGSDHYDNL